MHSDAHPEGAGSIPHNLPQNAGPLRAQLQFTGTGAEYFRIWIVHALFTLLTLGIYSAWAKVRKARWFAQHTQLLGDSFDFHGRPARILIGRVVALVLFLAYTYSFDWSATVGIAVILLLLVLGPLLFGSAQRFRLVNTSWRGLRFGFDAPRGRIYAVCIPLVLVWTAGTVWAAMQGSVPGAIVIGVLSVATWPAIHGALKTLQHRHARIGALRFEFRSAIGAFYILYARVLGFAFVMAVLVVVAGAMMAGLITLLVDDKNAFEVWALGLVMGALIVLLMYATSWPYFAARMQQLVWERTTAGGLRFHSSIVASRMWSLVMKQMFLVFITLGFYWPFAAVAIARYRVESLSVETDGQWPLLEAPHAADGNAVGDATLDFFDLDLGW